MYNGIFLLTLFGVVGAKQRSDLVSLPAVGSDLSQVVGQVLYNFSKFFSYAIGIILYLIRSLYH